MKKIRIFTKSGLKNFIEARHMTYSEFEGICNIGAGCVSTWMNRATRPCQSSMEKLWAGMDAIEASEVEAQKAIPVVAQTTLPLVPPTKSHSPDFSDTKSHSPDSGDSRTISLSLTSRGARLLDEVLEFIRDEELAMPLNAGELQRLREVKLDLATARLEAERASLISEK
jgi:hypothetical protein